MYTVVPQKGKKNTFKFWTKRITLRLTFRARSNQVTLCKFKYFDFKVETLTLECCSRIIYIYVILLWIQYLSYPFDTGTVYISLWLPLTHKYVSVFSL